MSKIVTRRLPHKVGTAEIASPELKRIAMLFMENFKSLDERIKNIESALIQAQKKGG